MLLAFCRFNPRPERMSRWTAHHEHLAERPVVPLLGMLGDAVPTEEAVCNVQRPLLGLPPGRLLGIGGGVLRACLRGVRTRSKRKAGQGSVDVLTGSGGTGRVIKACRLCIQPTNMSCCSSTEGISM